MVNQSRAGSAAPGTEEACEPDQTFDSTIGALASDASPSTARSNGHHLYYRSCLFSRSNSQGPLLLPRAPILLFIHLFSIIVLLIHLFSILLLASM